MVSKSTKAKAPGKRKHGDAPPFNNGHNRWCKKVGGRLIYLGSVAADPLGDNARRVWSEQRDAIRAGRPPVLNDGQPPAGVVTVEVLCNQFLAAKEGLIDTGELSPRTFSDYLRTCKQAAGILGKHRHVADLAPADFEKLRTGLAKGRGLIAEKNHLIRVRVMFKWGAESELLDHPVRYGLTFKLPKADKLRAARNEKEKKFFEQPELRKIIAACGVHMRAMTLLGINCGIGPADCSRLRFKHLDLKGGWLDFPRPKTAEPRRAKMWRETVDAINASLAKRPGHAELEHKDRVFLTRYGRPWYDEGSVESPVSSQFAKVLRKLKLKRLGVNFYSLRHVTQTIGERAGDAPALRRLMGHCAPNSDMASVYRESIDDDRLEAVATTLHRWLYPRKAK